MAVRIPGYISSTSIETDRGGMPRPHFDKSLGNAIAGFGAAMTNAGVDAMQEQQQRALFDDQTKYMLHREQTQTALEEAKNGMPADGSGFTSGFFAARQKADEQWLGSISPQNRERFQQKWLVDQENFRQAASKTEYAARGKYEIDGLNSALDVELRKVAADPAYKDRAVENLGALLGNTTAITEAERVGVKKNMAAMLDRVAALGEYKGNPDGLAKALGITPLSVKSKWAGTEGAPQPGAGMAPEAVRSVFLDTVKKQGLVGVVPKDGAKYGIKTGSAEEWANFFTGLAKHESGLDNRTVGDVGQFEGGSRGLLQLSYNDAQSYGFNAGKPFTKEQLADPNFNANVGVAIAKSLLDKHGSIQGGLGKYWGPISREGWVPGQGRDRGLPWASWGAEVASGPTKANAAAGQGKVDPMGDPRFSAIPFADRVKMVEQAYAERDQTIRQQKAEMNAFQSATKENFALAIETGDPSVNRAAILEAQQSGMIDAGHAVSLLKAWDEKFSKDRAVLDFLSGMERGDMQPAPFDAERQKGVDGAFDQVKKIRPDAAQSFAEDATAKAGTAPKAYVNDLRGEIESTDPQKVLAGLQKAQRLRSASPTALSRDGFGKVEEAATGFTHMVEDLGYTPEEAARRYAKMNDPEARKPADAATIDKAAKKLTVSDITNAAPFDSLFKFEPKGGFANEQAQAMLGDFRDIFRIEYEATGDEAIAKGRAIGKLQKMYGETRLSGSAVLMKHPPENYYPPVDGSHEWMQTQLRDAVKEATGKDYEAGKLFIVATRATDADVRSKKPPAYEVWAFEKDQNGYEVPSPVSVKGRFAFDPQAALNKPARLEERRKMIEAERSGASMGLFGPGEMLTEEGRARVAEMRAAAQEADRAMMAGRDARQAERNARRTAEADRAAAENQAVRDRGADEAAQRRAERDARQNTRTDARMEARRQRERDWARRGK